MKDDRIKIIITEEGLYSKWVGAELVSAIDMRNYHAVSYVLRNRKTLTTTSMLGKEGDPDIAVYVEAIGEEGRFPVALFKMTKKMYGEHHKPETDQDTLHRLSHLIEEHYCEVVLDWEEEEDEELSDVKLAVDKTSN